VNGGSLNGFQEILGMAGMAFCADESTIKDRHKQHNAAHACSNTSINAQRNTALRYIITHAFNPKAHTQRSINESGT
jgi:hypothetical protein